MADIYGTTTHNLIWLGEEEPYTQSALSAICAIGEEIREETEDFALLRDMLYDENTYFRYLDSHLKAQYDTSALVSMICAAEGRPCLCCSLTCPTVPRRRKTCM